MHPFRPEFSDAFRSHNKKIKRAQLKVSRRLMSGFHIYNTEAILKYY